MIKTDPISSLATAEVRVHNTNLNLTPNNHMLNGTDPICVIGFLSSFVNESEILNMSEIQHSSPFQPSMPSQQKRTSSQT